MKRKEKVAAKADTDRHNQPQKSGSNALPETTVQEPLQSLVQRAVHHPDSLIPADAVKLQRSIGNRSLGRLAARTKSPAFGTRSNVAETSLRRMLDNRAVAINQMGHRSPALVQALRTKALVTPPPASPTMPAPTQAVIQRYPADELVTAFGRVDPKHLQRLIGFKAYQVFVATDKAVLDPLLDYFRGIGGRIKNAKAVIDFLKSLSGDKTLLKLATDLLNKENETQTIASKALANARNIFNYLQPYAKDQIQLAFAKGVLEEAGDDPAVAGPKLLYLLPYSNNEAHLQYARQVLGESGADPLLATTNMFYYQQYLDNPTLLALARQVLGEQGDTAKAGIEMEALKLYNYDRTLKAQVESTAKEKVELELAGEISALESQKEGARKKYPSLSAKAAKEKLTKDIELRAELDLTSASTSDLGKRGRDAMDRLRQEAEQQVEQQILVAKSGQEERQKGATTDITRIVSPLMAHGKGVEMAKWALEKSGVDTDRLRIMVAYLDAAIKAGFDAGLAQQVTEDMLAFDFDPALSVIQAYNRDPADWTELKALITAPRLSDIAFALTKSKGREMGDLKKILELLKLPKVNQANLDELLKLESQPKLLEGDLTVRQRDPDKLATLLSKVQTGPAKARQTDRTKIDELVSKDKDFHTHKLLKLGVDVQALIDAISVELPPKRLADITAEEGDQNAALGLIDYAKANKSHIKVLLEDRKRDAGIVKRMKGDGFTTTRIEELARFETDDSPPSENKYARLDHFATRHTYKYFIFSSAEYDDSQGMWPEGTDAAGLKKYVDDALTGVGLDSSKNNTWVDNVYDPAATNGYDTRLRVADWSDKKKVTQFYPKRQGSIRTFTRAEVEAFEKALKN